MPVRKGNFVHFGAVRSARDVLAARPVRSPRSLLPLALLTTSASWLAIVGCGSSDGDEAPTASAPSADTAAPLEWVGPSADDLQVGDVAELVVTTQDPAARTVRFEVDGVELGVCDPRLPEEDCRRAATWRWSTVFERAGDHVARATLARDGAPDVVAEQVLHVAQSLPDVDDEPADRDVDAAAPDEDRRDPLGRSTGSESLDPAHPFHGVFGGIEWSVSDQQVRLHDRTPRGSLTAVARCMARYGDAIRYLADARKLSRASLVATAITESSCTNPSGSRDGLSSGPVQVTAALCASLTGLSRSVCRRRMHTDPFFSFDVGTKYIGSTYQRRVHRRDPPKIAAGYNAGSITKSFKNRWRMRTTGNHIDRWVNAYNAYRAWSLRPPRDGTGGAPARTEDLELSFEGEHVKDARELPTTARPGQVAFVGNWEERDGDFWTYEGGAWRGPED